MNELQWICFMVYTGFLAWEDLKTGSVSLLLIVSGALAGLGFLGLELMQGGSLQGSLAAHGPALFWGLLLLLAARLSRGAVGKGDGLCFLSFACWWNYIQLFMLLFLSLLFSALFGTLLILCKRKDRKASLPLMPFLWGAAWLLPILFLSPPG